jgi:hypothetical protein
MKIMIEEVTQMHYFYEMSLSENGTGKGRQQALRSPFRGLPIKILCSLLSAARILCRVADWPL